MLLEESANARVNHEDTKQLRPGTRSTGPLISPLAEGAPPEAPRVSSCASGAQPRDLGSWVFFATCSIQLGFQSPALPDGDPSALSSGPGQLPEASLCSWPCGRLIPLALSELRACRHGNETVCARVRMCVPGEPFLTQEVHVVLSCSPSSLSNQH